MATVRTDLLPVVLAAVLVAGLATVRVFAATPPGSKAGRVSTDSAGALPRPPVNGRDPAGISVADQSNLPSPNGHDASEIGIADELIVPEVSPRFADLFQARSYRYTGGVYEDEVFPCRLFIPVIEPEQTYPIVVWLHGHGEAGSDNVMHLAWLGERMMLPPWRRERLPFFVLCVPCPIENDFWNGYPTGTAPEKRAGSSMIRVTDAILTDVSSKFAVDQDRIYLTGVSSGGSGCWHYALEFPDRFAAVAPLAGGRVLGEYAQLVDVPVWCFHSTHDTGAPVDGARRNVAALRAAGGEVKLTEIDTVSHDCWTAAFGTHRLLAWMLAQRRDRPAVMDIRPWQQRIADWTEQWLAGWTWMQLAGQAVVVVLLVTGSYAVLKRVRAVRLRLGEREESGSV